MNAVVYVHNAMQALKGFRFDGIQDYASRALTNPGGIAIIANPTHMQDSILSILQYYHTISLGVDSAWCLQADATGDLYPALRDENVKKILRNLTNEGYKVEFFNTRERMEEDVVRDLGLDWNAHTISLPSSLADRGNNKAHVRCVAAQLGLGDLFPPHMVVSGRGDLTKAFYVMKREYGEVAIKLPAWASGLGMSFGGSKETLSDFISKHRDRLHDVIVERSLGADHISMTIVKRFVKGCEVDSWITNQDCLQANGSVSHVGSVLGELPHVTSEDAEWMQRATAPLYAHFLRQHPNLTGVINWDCIKSASGERFVLEGNFRVTFSTYIRSIQTALSKARGAFRDPVTCIVQKVTPRKEINSFAHLRVALGESLLMNVNSSGVIPIVLPCLPRNGYCYFVAVGSSYSDAFGVLTEAVERTCGRERLAVS